MNNCTLCDEVENESKNLFYNTIGKKLGIKSRILFQDENWIVVPAIGSFISGYLLIVSKIHFLSIANFTDNLFPSFISLLDKIGVILSKQFSSSYVAFEHGTTSTEYRLSCCVDHMHLHILPFTKDCWKDIVQKYNLEYKEIASLNEIKEYVEKYFIKSYLFFQNTDQRKYIIDSSKNIFPSQFFRQIISKEIDGKLKWDWRHYFYENNIIETINFNN